MKAVILAAGEGKRLRPFTETKPKVMLPVANKPIVEHVVDALAANGIQDIIIVVGYKKESIMQHFKSYQKANIHFATQEKQLGTAHALMQAAQFIDDSFIVLPGDNIISSSSISKLIQHQNEYVIGVKRSNKPSKYGMVSLSNKKLNDIIEKPAVEQDSLISTGIYTFPTSIFKSIQLLIDEGDYTITSLIRNELKKETNITAVELHDWIDVVYPWDLLSVNDGQLRKTNSSINGIIEKNVTIKGPVFIGKNTHIHSGTYIVGPVIIGENCEIGPYTCIFPSTTIGDNSIIRSFSEIRNSVIMKDVNIGSNTAISHSVIGTGSSVEQGYSTLVGAAKKHCNEECISVKDIGVMIAEDSIIQPHVITHPGVIISRYCQISPLKQIQ
ncbi:MAG: sugar phosphate nucleotidyltransferase, partial [Thermoplasmatota archaeon]